MGKVRTFATPVVLALLLSAVMVGVTGAIPTSSPSAAACTWTLTVPAAAFHPEDNGYNFYNSGWMLRSEDAITERYYTAHVPFPCTGEVTVDSVDIMGYDNNTSYEMCFALLRLDPLAPSRVEMGGVCTGNESASTTDPDTWTIPSLDPSTIGPNQGAYLWLKIADNHDLHLYGVKITYQSCECCLFPLVMVE
jgi:hypothetical protein